MKLYYISLFIGISLFISTSLKTPVKVLRGIKQDVIYNGTNDTMYMPIFKYKSTSEYNIHIPSNVFDNQRTKIVRFGYATIIKVNGYYYMMQNFYNQGNMILKSKDLSSGKLRMFNLLRELDPHGNMAATMTLYHEGNLIYYIGSSASGNSRMPFGDGHYGALLDTNTLKPVKSELSLVLKSTSLDTLPSIVKFNDKYYKYSRINNRRRGYRWESICISDTLFDSTPAVCNKLEFKHWVYSANIFIYNNTFHGFFWAHAKNKQFYYEDTFIFYATSKNGTSFDIIRESIGKNWMPVNGHIVENGIVYVYFQDFYKNIIIPKKLSSFM